MERVDNVERVIMRDEDACAYIAALKQDISYLNNEILEVRAEIQKAEKRAAFTTFDAINWVIITVIFWVVILK